MSDIQTKVIISHNLSLAGYQVLIFNKDINTGQQSSGVVTFEEIEAGAYTPPTLFLCKEELQFLMEELWALGIRPENSIDVKNIINAKDSHIDDLRKIAFKGLGVKL